MVSRENTLNGSEPDPSGQTHMAATNATKLTLDETLRYINIVKEIFRNQRDKYDLFLNIMTDFKSSRLDVAGLASRVEELFRGHPSLISGFNRFLPNGYEIKTDDEEPCDYESAVCFIQKVKNRFRANKHVPQSFIDIMKMYKNANKPAGEVFQEVTALFQHHTDLLEDFTNFLPRVSSPTGQHHVSSGGGFMHQEKSTITPIMPATKPYRMEKNEGANNSCVDCELSFDRPDPDQSDHDLDEKYLKHDGRDLDNGPRKRIKTCRSTDDTSDGNMHQSGEGSENFGTYSISASSSDDDRNAIKSAYSHDFYYSETVEEMLSPITYQKFLQCLHMHCKDLLDRADLMIKVREIFWKHPDLMVGFEGFLDMCKNKDGFLEAIIEKKLSWDKEQLARSAKVEDKGRERMREKDGRERDCERDNKERERLDKGTAFVARNASHHKVKLFTKEECNTCTPTSELDLSNCKKCTTSYRLLPKDYQMLLASKKKSSVLNDVCVSVTLGSEDSSFKHMRKNQYEESLFRCEEDRFELDMLLEAVRTTTIKAEKLIEKIQEMSSPESTDIVDEHFSRQNLRCIENLYGDHGLDVVDILRNNATVALPVILTRLKQKQEEWSRCYLEFDMVWADVYAKNHHKTLDHRSLYFKQQEAKSLSTKALLAEIKEISEEKQEDDILPAISAVNQRPIVPDMEFEYPDTEIHEDLYRIIKYSCGEVCTSADLVDQVMRVWTTFLEPMLGVPPRPPRGENGDIVKSGVASAWKSNGNPGADGDVASRKLTGYDGIAEGVEKSHVRTNLEITSGVSPTPPRFRNSGNEIEPEPHIANNEVLALEGGNTVRTVSVNGDCTAESNNKEYRYPQSSGSHHSFGIESEEGEISESKHLEEENFVYFKDAANDADDDEDEGSAQKSTEDSENASDAGEEVSGSESADGDECSREDHEEEDNADQDAKAESGGEAEENMSLPFSECFLHTAKPLAKLVPSPLHDKEDNDSHIFYGNDSFYVLFRLHQTLYERVLSAKANSANANQYAKFMGALYKLLDGSSDSTKFEYDCLAIIGSQSYVLFTLDRLICKVVKQLQAIVADDVDNTLNLYLYEKSRRPGRFFDTVYHENARVWLHDKSLYRLERSSKNSNRLSIQLMEHEHEKPEATAVSMDPDFAGYLYDELLSCSSDDKEIKGVFMGRNKRKFGTDQIVKAMEGTLVSNGLELKIACDSLKMSYVMETEDWLFRMKKRRRSDSGASCCEPTTRVARKVQRFHSFLNKFPI